jgi:hypothetical protein
LEEVLLPHQKTTITVDSLAHINYCPQLDLVYVVNPKAACSTTKQSIWQHCDSLNNVVTYPGNPHGERHKTPFLHAAYPANIYPSHLAKFGEAEVFTAMRNPYSRALSAYIDKIELKREKPIWSAFAQRFRLELDARPTFLEFLRFIKDEIPYLLDRHFAPQYVDILWNVMRFDRIFFFEEFEVIRQFLGSKGINVSGFTAHATDAAEKINQ